MVAAMDMLPEWKKAVMLRRCIAIFESNWFKIHVGKQLMVGIHCNWHVWGESQCYVDGLDMVQEGNTCF